MKIICARNVHSALPQAAQLLEEYGYERNSRNGEVILAPWPVITEYDHPWERVIFWEERDANPFFHLYESLWMLAGRNDIAPLVRYAKNMEKFTDDGVTQPGAYGYRWRHYQRDNLSKFVGAVVPDTGIDQLSIIARRLRENHDDRRCVLQMWNPVWDLDSTSVDVPCNLTATFQVSQDAELELTVFCRSNDIIWGAYGANAVHFSMMQEYMAHAIGIPMGVYRQISVNWHAYKTNFDSIRELNIDAPNPYHMEEVSYLPLCNHTKEPGVDNHLAIIDMDLKRLLHHADNAFNIKPVNDLIEPFFIMAGQVLLAHQMFKSMSPPDKYDLPIAFLTDNEYATVDWVVAAREWLQRRKDKYEGKLEG